MPFAAWPRHYFGFSVNTSFSCGGSKRKYKPALSVKETRTIPKIWEQSTEKRWQTGAGGGGMRHMQPLRFREGG
jgi:hypothetical protein